MSRARRLDSHLKRDAIAGRGLDRLCAGRRLGLVAEDRD
jgi:hypothetical protein